MIASYLPCTRVWAQLAANFHLLHFHLVSWFSLMNLAIFFQPGLMELTHFSPTLLYREIWFTVHTLLHLPTFMSLWRKSFFCLRVVYFYIRWLGRNCTHYRNSFMHPVLVMSSYLTHFWAQYKLLLIMKDIGVNGRDACITWPQCLEAAAFQRHLQPLSAQCPCLRPLAGGDTMGNLCLSASHLMPFKLHIPFLQLKLRPLSEKPW